MPWEKEEAFRVLLHKIATKATPERLAKAAASALENDEAAVKYVSGIILKEMKQLKPTYKLRVFFAFSSIARASVAKYGSRSKYAARWAIKLETIAGLLSEIPPNDKIQVARVLQLWWRDGIFPPNLGTEVVITRNVRHDAPASPPRDIENPAQEPSSADDSPLPESSSRQVGAAAAAYYYNNDDETHEDDSMPRVPQRRMITLASNRQMNI
ncbi:hypothetical protein Ndes2526B_g09303 [Nannochloris sp. 'desiccata']